MTDFDPGDDELVPVIAGLLGRYVDDVRRTHGIKVPRLRSQEFLDAPEPVQLASLVLLGSSWLWGMPGLALIKDVSVDIHQAGRDLYGRDYWSRVATGHTRADTARRTRIPRAPARCEHCHERLTTTASDGGTAA